MSEKWKNLQLGYVWRHVVRYSGNIVPFANVAGGGSCRWEAGSLLSQLVVYVRLRHNAHEARRHHHRQQQLSQVCCDGR